MGQSGAKYTTVSDLLYTLFVNVADENPEKLETYLPQAISHLLEQGKSADSKSKFWSKENYTNAVTKFAQTISQYDSPKLPGIFFNSLVKPLIEKNMLNWKGIVLLPKDTEEVNSSKPYFALIYFILNEYKREKNVEAEFKPYIEKLKKIADDMVEEDDYLIDEIQALTGEDLDEYFLNLFKLAK